MHSICSILLRIAVDHDGDVDGVGSDVWKTVTVAVVNTGACVAVAVCVVLIWWVVVLELSVEG